MRHDDAPHTVRTVDVTLCKGDHASLIRRRVGMERLGCFVVKRLGTPEQVFTDKREAVEAYMRANYPAMGAK